MLGCSFDLLGFTFSTILRIASDVTDCFLSFTLKIFHGGFYFIFSTHDRTFLNFRVDL